MKSWPLFMKVALVCGTILTTLVLTCVLSVKWHDAQLSRLQSALRALRHPVSSALLAEHGEIANFGNGNHLDYWAAQLRSITGPRSALKKAYGKARVAVPNYSDGNDDFQDVVNGKQLVYYQLLPSPLPTHYRLQCGSSYSWDLSRFAGRKGLYTVEILNSGQDSNTANFFDWRGI